jgi:hypothetical protein
MRMQRKFYNDHMTSKKNYKSESESVNSVIGSSWNNIRQFKRQNVTMCKNFIENRKIIKYNNIEEKKKIHL